ncbi:MAG: CFI-box-CTERM domain-containing protein [Pseudobdellovibrionaceae bacterium]
MACRLPSAYFYDLIFDMRNIKNKLNSFSLRALFISLLIISCGAFSPVYATVTVTAIEGASSSSGTETPNVYVIYGAAIGDSSETACKELPTPTTFCNNCVGSSISGCSERRIHPKLNLKITLKTDKKDALKNAQGLILIGSTPVDTYKPAVSGDLVTFEIPWEFICDKIGATADCSETKKSENFKIGFDAGSDNTLDDELAFQFKLVKPADDLVHQDCLNTTPENILTNEGLCSFQVFAGDSKFQITNTAANVTTYPSSGVGDTNWKAVRFYYKAYDPPTTAAPDFSDFGPGSAGVKYQTLTLKVSGTGTSKEVYIDAGENILEDDLENGKFYCVRAANVDMAENIYKFSSDAFLTENNDLTADLPIAEKEWRFCGTPDEVVGLLKDQKCFIATATYGSPIAPQVKLLREFRNKYLLPYSFGRKVVQFYYKHSPRIAYFIEASPLLKTISWIALTPVIGVVAIWMSDYFFLVVLLLSAFIATASWVVIYKPKTRLLK